MSNYSLGRSRKILCDVYSTYKKKHKDLLEDEISFLEENLEKLDQAVLDKDKKSANDLAKSVEPFLKKYPKGIFHYIKSIFITLFIVIVAVLIIQQSWFEICTISSDAMHPTLQKNDRVFVSKTSFGINVPFTNRHFYFDQDLLNRTDIIIFNLGRERLTRRCIGFPGDLIYFHEGQIYGIDKNGEEISEFYRASWLKDIKYKAIKENGPPLNEDGTINKELIQLLGLKVPLGHYFVLSDNPDFVEKSPDFNFVPEENIRGSASAILWPMPKRWGAIKELDHKWLTLPNFIMFVIVMGIVSLCFWHDNVSRRKRIFRKIP